MVLTLRKEKRSQCHCFYASVAPQMPFDLCFVETAPQFKLCPAGRTEIFLEHQVII